MILDCHVHISALTDGCGSVSPQLMSSAAFRFIRWKFALGGDEPAAQEAMARQLAQAVESTPELDAAVALAFDAVYDDEGRLDAANTHLSTTNDYVMELIRHHRKVLFGASVHPYRKDAVAELERCIRGGAVLLKWLPLTQRFNPADDRCIPMYEALAHYKLPLLSHTGGEETLPILSPEVADPMLLVPALKRGVTVIAAHCGTRSRPWHRDFLPEFTRLAQDYEHFYGDTSGLTVPNRSYAFRHLLEYEPVRRKLVHGSDWPIPSLPPLRRLGMGQSLRMMREPNWMRRDILIKRSLGLDNDYWHRAGRILRLAGITSAENSAHP